METKESKTPAIRGEWAGPCPSCEAVGSCCQAAKDRLATADSLGRLVDRQGAVIGDWIIRNAEIQAVEAKRLEQILARYKVDELGIIIERAFDAGHAAAQEDVAVLVRALLQVKTIARRPS